MATRIKLKTSTVADKVPAVADLAIGEIGLNANAASVAAYIKDTDNNIIQIGGPGSTDIPNLQSVCNEGSTTTTGSSFGGTVTANLFSGPLPYSDLTGTPTIPTDNSQLTNGAGYITSAGTSADADKLDGQEGTYYLDYANFTNTPPLITNNNQLTNGAGYITSGGTSGDADKLDGQDGAYYLNYANFTNTPTIPTNTNQLTNGSGYITINDVPNNNNQLINGAGYYSSGDSPSFATVTATTYNLSALPSLP